MESYLFADVEAAADTMVVEGYHKPGSLTRSSGAWIHAAGTAMFEAGRRPIKPHDQWIWFAVEAGEATLVWQGHELTLKQQETSCPPATATLPCRLTRASAACGLRWKARLRRWSYARWVRCCICR